MVLVVEEKAVMVVKDLEMAQPQSIHL